METPLIELQEVSRRFPAGDGEVAALDRISLAIHAGEMVAIVGASGSGKSTLMNILGCLDRPSSGSYLVAGQSVGAMDNDALTRLRREYFGFIFQRYHLLPHLDAVQNVEIPAVYAGLNKAKRRQRALELLGRLSLDGRFDHRPGQLSGGQQQRVSIARALMNGGDVILADEPTGALDSRSGREMLEVLHELHGLGHTIIIVTHDMNVAAHAGRIIEISDGRIVRDEAHVSEQATAAETGAEGALQHVDAGGGGGVKAAWSRFGEAFTMAWIAMISHRLRTLLTMLGIIIGITAVVSVVAIGQGAQQKVVSDISSMGTNVIDIFPGKDWGDEKAASIHTLMPADLEALQAQSYLDSVTPVVNSSTLLRYRNITANASVSGVSEQYFRVRGQEMAQGVGFTVDDMHSQTQVVVIDHNTAKKFFSSVENPLGNVIFLGKLPCRIIGVTKDKESPFGGSQNLSVWIPYTAAMGRFLGQQYLSSITVRVRDGFSNPVAEQNIVRLLTLRHGSKDFYTSSSDTIMKTVNKTTTTLTLLISAIAVISLVVGGIGVMNIMLVSVTERTHEIGIRMAVGARQSDILQQFLIEAVLVCLIGGSIGIICSLAVGLIFSLFVSIISMKFSTASFVYAFICSSLIGVIFGFLPARNAARLDPIEALARE